jgi:putative ABC transport system ATP-binding protein
MTERQAEVYRLTKVGFIFQFFNLVPSLSASENLELPMLLADKPKEERRHRCQELLAAFGLEGKGHKRPEELSGGEQQRVAVCLALVNDPDLILADEPTGNLDVANMEVISNLLISLARDRGKTVIVTTHDQKMGSAFPKVFRMRDGRFERNDKQA